MLLYFIYLFIYLFIPFITLFIHLEHGKPWPQVSGEVQANNSLETDLYVASTDNTNSMCCVVHACMHAYACILDFWQGI
jgi:hypothetical protein